MDDLLDFFDRDRRTREGDRAPRRGLRGLLHRLTEGEEPERASRLAGDEDDHNLPRGHHQRRERDGFDPFDL